MGLLGCAGRKQADELADVVQEPAFGLVFIGFNLRLRVFSVFVSVCVCVFSFFLGGGGV